MRHPGRRLSPLVIALVAGLTLAWLPAAASALAVSVTGDDGQPVALNPAAPPTIRTLRPTVGIAGDVGGGRYSVAFTSPDGKPAADPVACQDPATPTSVQLPFKGNGGYTVAVTVYALGDTTCTVPAGAAASFPFTIAGRVALGDVTSFVLRAVGSTTRKPLALPVAADPGSQSREIRFAANAKLAKDGSIRGKPLRAGFKDGTATLLFPAPGTYTVVARDAADGQFTPWSAPLRIQVVTPFDLFSLSFPDTSGPDFRALASAVPGATGVVRVALARGKGAFHRLGRARINASGAFGARFTAEKAGKYRLRFTYRGNNLVTRGTIVRSFRVGTAIVGG